MGDCGGGGGQDWEWRGGWENGAAGVGGGEYGVVGGDGDAGLRSWGSALRGLM